MAHLIYFKRFVFLGLVLLFMSPIASAALFQLQYVDEIAETNIAGLSAGDIVEVTIGLDNGGTTIIDQSWGRSDIQSVTWDFGNGALVTTFLPNFDGGLFLDSGVFETDGDELFEIMDLGDRSINSDYVTNWSGEYRDYEWWIDYQDRSFVFRARDFDDDSQFVRLPPYLDIRPNGLSIRENWTFVSPVPVPAAVWLFGTALIGLVGFNKRTKAV